MCALIKKNRRQICNFDIFSAFVYCRIRGRQILLVILIFCLHSSRTRGRQKSSQFGYLSTYVQSRRRANFLCNFNILSTYVQSRTRISLCNFDILSTFQLIKICIHFSSFINLYDLFQFQYGVI